MIDAVYHIQHVNALHSCFKRWLPHFNGMYSKYISNYLAWLKFLQLSKKIRNLIESKTCLYKCRN